MCRAALGSVQRDAICLAAYDDCCPVRSHPPAAHLQAASGEYAALLAEVQQLAESTRLAGRQSTASGAGSRAAASGAPVIDIE